MKPSFFILIALLTAAAVIGSAAPSVTTGVPANSYLATPTGATPSFGTLFNFDALTPLSMFNASTYAAQGVSISSPDGLIVEPYSSQSAPNELFDNSSKGSANITIKTLATNQIGIGIADSDGVSVTLQALNASGSTLGSAFSITLPAAGSNPGNGYFVVSDTSSDIYGLQIVQGLSNGNFSGLAIDDLQVATATPEPSTYALLGAGAALLGMLRLRKRS